MTQWTVVISSASLRTTAILLALYPTTPMHAVS
jgi:hypothetical protein